jgi:hypothetical protein
MKKKVVPVEKDERRKYNIKFQKGTGRESKVLFLDRLTLGEMNEVTILIGELKIEDTGDLISNSFALNSAMSENDVTPKLCSIILRDEKGKRYPEEFYNSCVHNDLIKPTEDFFNGEGSNLLKAIARVVYAPLLKQMEGQNDPALIKANDPTSLFYNRIKVKVEELRVEGKITSEIEELVLSIFHTMQ